MLTDSGYDDMSQMTTKGIEAYLTQRREDCFAELEKSAPDKAIFDVFKLKYDYHNAKAMLKCEALGLDPERLLVDTGRVAPETLAEAVKRSEFTDLPKVMADAIVEAAKKGPFLSKDDFRERSKASKTIVELLDTLGILGDLPESNQISLFDFMVG